MELQWTKLELQNSWNKKIYIKTVSSLNECYKMNRTVAAKWQWAICTSDSQWLWPLWRERRIFQWLRFSMGFPSFIEYSKHENIIILETLCFTFFLHSHISQITLVITLDALKLQSSRQSIISRKINWIELKLRKCFKIVTNNIILNHHQHRANNSHSSSTSKTAMTGYRIGIGTDQDNTAIKSRSWFKRSIVK